MRYQKVNMIISFIVPVGEEHYGPRTTQAPWKQYAEHDMLGHLKDVEDLPPIYSTTADRWSDCSQVQFEWLEEFERAR